MPLTAEQLTDLQADLGISNDEAVFTDAELNRLYARAEDDYNATMVFALRQLLLSAAKRADYTQNSSSESRSQVFDNLHKLLEHWEAIAGLTGGQIRSGVLDNELDAFDNPDDWNGSAYAEL